MAMLASRTQGKKSSIGNLSGAKRAAMLMLALGEEYGGKIWSMLDDDEVRQISIVMSQLGTVDAASVEQLLLEFVSRLSASGSLMGNYDATERLLQKYLDPVRVSAVMEELRGPAGRNMWEKLSNVSKEVFANYLKNEYPQTIAVVISKLRPEQAARILAILPESLAFDVVDRMLRMETGSEKYRRAYRKYPAQGIHDQPVADTPCSTRTRLWRIYSTASTARLKPGS